MPRMGEMLQIPLSTPPILHRPLTAGGPSREPVSLGELSETMDKEETASGSERRCWTITQLGYLAWLIRASP